MKTPAGAVERRLRIALLVDRFGNRLARAEAYGVELMRVRGSATTSRSWRAISTTCLFLPIRFPGWLPSWMRVLYFAWRAEAHARPFDIVHSHMNGWAGEIQVMHVTPVRYNRLTRAAAQAADRLAQPRLATYLLLDHGPGFTAATVRAWLDIIAPGVKPRPPTPPSARPCATGWAGTPTPSVACWWRATRCAGAAGAAGRLSCPRTTGLLVVGAEATRERVRRRRHRAPGRPDRTHPEVAQYFSAADIHPIP